MAALTLADYATHSPYSDPGEHAALLRAVPPDPASVHAAACTAVVHYRAGNPTLTADQEHDVDTRWLAEILGVAAARQAGPLAEPRGLADQVAGCCRDHTLLAVGVLREQGVPARSRVGFAGYFEPGFHHDHVVAEWWDGRRWVRSDPELAAGPPWDFDVHDVPRGPGAPFETAAEVWRAVRSGDADPATYGVAPGLPELGGRGFVRDYVLLELAHRQKDELLLWDLWGPMVPAFDGGALAPGVPGPGDPAYEAEFDALADDVAALLVAADATDGATGGTAAAEAEEALAERYASDARLRPGSGVVTASPSGRVGQTDLAGRTTTWRAAP
ncbi:transglutaminase-like domain-containing protein [Cellulomonas sp. PhB143]|uniref:transglutaminase-like domain-containing protein n=1 Tax=Cellulomonas sp. PhB143 TaxID=2485186 RepID=UPI000F478D4C|nr:transglutaminase-like domain-containing protein [Cellulomonas sp. PhB143]ROS72060.1 transglutaminase superfamily protein [Cellulomonas sp. PhB143]